MGNGASVEGDSTEQLDLTTTKAIAGEAFDAGRFEAVAFVNDAGHKVVTRGALQAQAALADVTVNICCHANEALRRRDR